MVYLHPDCWKSCSVGLLVFLYIVLFAAVCQAQPGRVYFADTADKDFTSLWRYTDYIEDVSGGLTFAEISSPEFEGRFRQMDRTSGIFGHTRRVIWARIKLATQRGSTNSVINFSPLNDHAVVYRSRPDGTYDSIPTGLYHPFNPTQTLSRFGHLTLNITQQPQTIYARVWNETPAGFVWCQAFFNSTVEILNGFVRRDLIVSCIYLGIMLSLIGYNLCIALSTKDSLYWRYVVYITTFLIWQFTDWCRTIIVDEPLPFLPLINFMFGGFTLCVGWVFIAHFLESKRIFPLYHRVVTWSVGIVGVWAILVNPMIFSPFTQRLANLCTVVVLLMIWSAGIVAWRRKVRSARYFMLAFSGLIASVILVMLGAIGILGGLVFSYGNPSIYGSAIEMILLSFALADKMNAVKDDRARLEIEHIREKARRELAEQEMEQEHVRNVELTELNGTIIGQAEEIRRQYEELQAAQTQLIHAEKMAAFGRLAAGVAHEINTPLGAIRASACNIETTIDETLSGLPNVITGLDESERALFVRMLRYSRGNSRILTSREHRSMRNYIGEVCERGGVTADIETIADTLTDVGIAANIEEFLPLLRRADAEEIVQTAYNFSGIHRNTNTITTAVGRASKIVFALKSYAREGQSVERGIVNIPESIETVLTLYGNQLKQGVEVIREYGERVPEIHGYADELYQVWTNIIHNALQAMVNKGTLRIEVHPAQIHPTQTLPQREGFSSSFPSGEGRDGVLIRFTDTGGGIAPEVMPRIFEPFFSTKTSGEGTGLGLDICRKIIEKHGGTITLENNFGVGVTAAILLPA